jgi:hypothetical protein
LQINGLPFVQPQEFPKVFIRQEWVEKHVDIILKHYEATDGISTELLAQPMALVAHSAAGKTRALLELSKSLGAKRIPVIYISFNTPTDYAEYETRNPLDSVLARIAYDFMYMGSCNLWLRKLIFVPGLVRMAVS